MNCRESLTYMPTFKVAKKTTFYVHDLFKWWYVKETIRGDGTLNVAFERGNSVYAEIR